MTQVTASVIKGSANLPRIFPRIVISKIGAMAHAVSLEFHDDPSGPAVNALIAIAPNLDSAIDRAWTARESVQATGRVLPEYANSELKAALSTLPIYHLINDGREPE